MTTCFNGGAICVNRSLRWVSREMARNAELLNMMNGNRRWLRVRKRRLHMRRVNRRCDDWSDASNSRMRILLADHCGARSPVTIGVGPYAGR